MLPCSRSVSSSRSRLLLLRTPFDVRPRSSFLDRSVHSSSAFVRSATLQILSPPSSLVFIFACPKIKQAKKRVRMYISGTRYTIKNQTVCLRVCIYDDYIAASIPVIPWKWAQEHSRSSWIKDDRTTHFTRLLPNLVHVVFLPMIRAPNLFPSPRQICPVQAAARAGISHVLYGVDLRNVWFGQNLV